MAFSFDLPEVREQFKKGLMSSHTDTFDRWAMHDDIHADAPSAQAPSIANRIYEKVNTKPCQQGHDWEEWQYGTKYCSHCNWYRCSCGRIFEAYEATKREWPYHSCHECGSQCHSDSIGYGQVHTDTGYHVTTVVGQTHVNDALLNSADEIPETISEGRSFSPSL